MNIPKYFAPFAILTALAISPVAHGQVPPSRTPITQDPSVTVITSGSVNEDHEGRGNKNGMDNGKKLGLQKDHKDHKSNLVLAGTISGNTLTVTEISSGHLEIGSVLSGNGIPQPIKIIAFGSGTGGVGTYTIEYQ